MFKPIDEKWLTAKEAAAKLGITLQALRYRIDVGVVDEKYVKRKKVVRSAHIYVSPAYVKKILRRDGKSS
jgi:hypothetical protein